MTDNTDKSKQTVAMTCPFCQSRVDAEDFRFSCPCCSTKQRGALYLLGLTCRACEYPLRYIPFPCCGHAQAGYAFFMGHEAYGAHLALDAQYQYPAAPMVKGGPFPIHVFPDGRRCYERYAKWVATRSGTQSVPPLEAFVAAMVQGDAPYPIPGLIIQRFHTMGDNLHWVHCDVMATDSPEWEFGGVVAGISVLIEENAHGALHVVRWLFEPLRPYRLPNARSRGAAGSLGGIRKLHFFGVDDLLQVAPTEQLSGGIRHNDSDIDGLFGCFLDIPFDLKSDSKFTLVIVGGTNKLPDESSLMVDVHSGEYSPYGRAGEKVASLMFHMPGRSRASELHTAGRAAALPLTVHTVPSLSECQTLSELSDSEAYRDRENYFKAYFADSRQDQAAHQQLTLAGAGNAIHCPTLYDPRRGRPVDWQRPAPGSDLPSAQAGDVSGPDVPHAAKVAAQAPTGSAQRAAQVVQRRQDAGSQADRALDEMLEQERQAQLEQGARQASTSNRMLVGLMAIFALLALAFFILVNS